jgi:hypothetical protein
MTAIIAFTWYKISAHRIPPPPQPASDTPAPKPTIGEDVQNVEPMRETGASVPLRYPDQDEEIVSANTAQNY